ncbi:hypothetical protein DQ392_02490 [Streptomyces reniochalinae]|uniref:Uncharacterized protein n=1 Tax=Streptomyces reniochalinae TaxID=2250578 RepID=A0A367F2K2_9ACTN|nr:hypothetical protein DQ392_02490 [Streptomyces reniochalinae]
MPPADAEAADTDVGAAARAATGTGAEPAAGTDVAADTGADAEVAGAGAVEVMAFTLGILPTRVKCRFRSGYAR